MRGGHREGQPGKAYANRTDLNGPGGATAAIMPEQVRSYGGQGATPPSALPGAGGGSGAPEPALPGAPMPPMPMGGFADPTERPDEQLTAGLGGRGGMLPDDPDELLRALYSQAPNDDLRRLLEMR